MYVAFSYQPKRLVAWVVISQEVKEGCKTVALHWGAFWICGLE